MRLRSHAKADSSGKVASESIEQKDKPIAQSSKTSTVGDTPPVAVALHESSTSEGKATDEKDKPNTHATAVKKPYPKRNWKAVAFQPTRRLSDMRESGISKPNTNQQVEEPPVLTKGDVVQPSVSISRPISSFPSSDSPQTSPSDVPTPSSKPPTGDVALKPPFRSVPYTRGASRSMKSACHSEESPDRRLRSAPLPNTHPKRKSRLQEYLSKSGSLKFSNDGYARDSDKFHEQTTPKEFDTPPSSRNPSTGVSVDPKSAKPKSSGLKEVKGSGSPPVKRMTRSNPRTKSEVSKQMDTGSFDDNRCALPEKKPIIEKDNEDTESSVKFPMDDLIAPPLRAHTVPDNESRLKPINHRQKTITQITRENDTNTLASTSPNEDDSNRFSHPSADANASNSSGLAGEGLCDREQGIRNLEENGDRKTLRKGKPLHPQAGSARLEKFSGNPQIVDPTDEESLNLEEESDEEIIIRRSRRRSNGMDNASGKVSHRSVRVKSRRTKAVMPSSAPLSKKRKLGTTTEAKDNAPPTFPNRYILKDGNTPAFRYTLQNGKKHTVYQWDTFNMSPGRYLSENSLILCADMLMRQRELGPAEGFELMDETLLLEALFRGPNPNLSRFCLDITRWEALFDSKLIFVPIFKANHWSLLAVAGCSDVLNVVMTKSIPGNSSPKRPAQLVAVHFDSLSSFGHRETVSNISVLVEKGINELWTHQYIRPTQGGPVLPDISAIVKSSLRIHQCDVEQQTDGVSCGWRTISHMLYLASAGVASTKDLISATRERVSVDFRATMGGALSIVGKLRKPATTDIPTLMYPLHAVVDHARKSFFDADIPDPRKKLILSHNRNSEANEHIKVPKNAKKKAQADAVRDVSRIVVAEMRKRELNKKQVLRKDVHLSEKLMVDIAKYLFHYPPGERYAECMYYTRYSYPDSFLVCLSIDVLFGANPRIFGESISPLCSRLKRSRSVHFQMDFFKSTSRTATKYYDETARFRLQEMVEHFRGIAEAVLKSCAKHALTFADISTEQGTKVSPFGEKKEIKAMGQVERLEVGKKEKDVTSSGEDPVDDDEDDADEIISQEGPVDLTSPLTTQEGAQWDFSSSVIFMRPEHNELGRIISNVSAKDIAEDIDTCLSIADYVSNEAIVSTIGDFEKYCRRKMQIRNRSVKVRLMRHRVTGQSVSTIPSMFSNEFVKLLKSEIQKVWGHELRDDFFQIHLDDLIARVMSASNSLFRRNGQVFLGIEGNEDFDDGDIEKIVSSKRKRKRTMTKTEIQSDSDLASEIMEKEKTQELSMGVSAQFESFALGYATDLIVGSETETSPDVELLVLIFLVLKDCHSHHANYALLNPRQNEILESSEDLSELDGKLSDVKDKCVDALKYLESEAQAWWEEDSTTLRQQVKRLKFKIVRRICQSITGFSKLSWLNSLFFYEVPITDGEKPNTEQNISNGNGKSITIYPGSGIGMEDVMWNLRASEIGVRQMSDCEAGIYRSNIHAILGQICVTKVRIPNVNILSVKATVNCTLDVWNEVELQVKGNQYLGVRRFDPVKIIFSIHQQSTQKIPHPLKSDYHHCFVGFIFDNPKPTGQDASRKRSTPSEVERKQCIGPMSCQFEVVLHDNLHASSGTAVSISSFIERWSSLADTERSCYVVPVEGLDVRQDVAHYYALEHIEKAPRISKLALVNFRLAESYEWERRRIHYQLMRCTIAEDPFQRHRFRPYPSLEDQNREMIRSVVGPFDQNFNDDQLEVIHKTLYGWNSDCSPNGSRVLEHITDDMKESLRSSRRFSKEDLDWWGSSLCVMDGDSGTGKSRTVAVLICSVLHSMALPSTIYGFRGHPRMLVVTVTNSAMEELYVSVRNMLRTFCGENRLKFGQFLKQMVCVSSEPVKELVRTNQVSYLARDGKEISVIESARAVFTTVSDLHRAEFRCSDMPYSLLVIEESEFLDDEGLIESLALAFVRYEKQEEFQRTAFLISGSHNPRGSKLSNFEKRQSNFFARTRDAHNTNGVSLRVSLSKKYGVAPSILQFLESTSVPEKKTLQEQANHAVSSTKNVSAFVTESGDADVFMNTLHSSKKHPLRNVVIIDTSLEKKDASFGSGDQAINKCEATIIGLLLSNWAGMDSIDSALLQKRVTVLCPSARQRIEITQRLAQERLPRVQVRTIDQVMGTRNDIIIVSLVFTGFQGLEESVFEEKLFPPDRTGPAWMKIACSRARKSLIVVGCGKFFCQQDSCWSSLFKRCLAEVNNNTNPTSGYYRPRYIRGRQDFKLATFSPLYAA